MPGQAGLAPSLPLPRPRPLHLIGEGEESAKFSDRFSLEDARVEHAGDMKAVKPHQDEPPRHRRQVSIPRPCGRLAASEGKAQGRDDDAGLVSDGAATETWPLICLPARGPWCLVAAAEQRQRRVVAEREPLVPD